MEFRNLLSLFYILGNRVICIGSVRSCFSLHQDKLNKVVKIYLVSYLRTILNDSATLKA